MSENTAALPVTNTLSPAFGAMTQSIYTCMGAFTAMQTVVNKGFQVTSINQAKETFYEINMAAGAIDNEMINAAAGQAAFNKEVQTGEQSTSSLLGKAGNLVKQFLTLDNVKAVLALSDQMTQTAVQINAMNDGMQSTEELQQKVMQSAQNSRTAYADMANAAAQMQGIAGGAFQSNDEMLAFMEQVNKQFALGGTSAAAQSEAMLQLSQAMSDGVINGSELNEILLSAPGIAAVIEESMGWASGSLQQYAQDGQVTAQVVKDSLLNMADETNTKFSSLPMTWSQVGTQMQNTALGLFSPVLEQVNQLANNESFQTMLGGLTSGLSLVADIAGMVFGAMADGVGLVIENWDMISPIVYGVAAAVGFYALAQFASAAITGIQAAASGVLAIAQMALGLANMNATIFQQGLNAAMLAFPGLWIVAIIIGIIVAIGLFISNMTGTQITVMGVFGAICGGINVVLQFFKNLALGVANIGLGIWAALNACAENIQTAFRNAILSIQSLFYNLGAAALGCIADIADGLSKLPFIEFDSSGLREKADEYKTKAAEKEAAKGTYKDIMGAYNNAAKTFDTFNNGWISSAYEDGNKWAKGMADKIKHAGGSKESKELTDKLNNLQNNPADSQQSGQNSSGGINPAAGISGIADNMAQTSQNTAATADNTQTVANNVDISNQQLKYLRDIAEREAVNRFTTAKIKVEMTNHNKINSGLDLDGIVNNLTSSVSSAMSRAAEGVHV